MIDYKAQPFEAAVSDVDVVLDTIGGDTQARSFSVLRRGGHLVSTVQPPNKALATAHGVKADFVFHQSDAVRLARLLNQVAAGSLKVLVDRTAPLAEVGEAFAYQASGRTRGKIILRMEDA